MATLNHNYLYNITIYKENDVNTLFRFISGLLEKISNFLLAEQFLYY